MKLDFRRVTGTLHLKALQARYAWQDFGHRHGLIETKIGTISSSPSSQPVEMSTEEKEHWEEFIAKARAQMSSGKSGSGPTL